MFHSRVHFYAVGPQDKVKRISQKGTKSERLGSANHAVIYLMTIIRTDPVK